MGKVPPRKVEDAKRLRYIRALERFVKSIGGYLLKAEDATYEAFVKRVSNGLEKLEKVEAMELYKNDMIELQALAEAIQTIASKDIEEIKKTVLYRINKWEQSKNRSKYKKVKHRKEMFEH